MPTYTYQEYLPDGRKGALFEYIQSMSEPALKTHPQSGNPVRKVFNPPNVAHQYSDRTLQAGLNSEQIEKGGFSRYERDPLTGRYHKTAGKTPAAPECYRPPKAGRYSQRLVTIVLWLIWPFRFDSDISSLLLG